MEAPTCSDGEPNGKFLFALSNSIDASNTRDDPMTLNNRDADNRRRNMHHRGDLPNPC